LTRPFSRRFAKGSDLVGGVMCAGRERLHHPYRQPRRKRITTRTTASCGSPNSWMASTVSRRNRMRPARNIRRLRPNWNRHRLPL